MKRTFGNHRHHVLHERQDGPSGEIPCHKREIKRKAPNDACNEKAIARSLDSHSVRLCVSPLVEIPTKLGTRSRVCARSLLSPGKRYLVGNFTGFSESA